MPAAAFQEAPPGTRPQITRAAVHEAQFLERLFNIYFAEAHDVGDRFVHEAVLLGMNMDADPLGFAPFDRPDPQAVRFMTQFNVQAIRNIGFDQRTKISRALLVAQREGLGVDRAKTLIARTFDAQEWRLHAIARTELNRAANWGRLTSWRKTGTAKKKRYVAVLDDRVRPGHAAAHGDEVPIDQPFREGAAAGFMAPPIAPNCRCAIVPVTGLGLAREVGDIARTAGEGAARGFRGTRLDDFEEDYVDGLLGAWRDLKNGTLQEVVG